MIKLSATLIKDVLSCSMKGYYRVKKPDAAVQNRDMLIGSIVHEVIEKAWVNKNLAFLEANKLCVGLPDDMLKIVNGHLESFFNSFRTFCDPEDEIEKKFTLSLGDDVVLTGKMDRVNPRIGLLLDWKTSKSAAPYIDNDIQFITYDYAYKRIYSKEPSLVAYASLTKGELIKYNYVSTNVETLFNEIIPKVTDIIRNDRYYRDGIFGQGRFFKEGYSSFTCHNCSYAEHCLKGLETD